MNHTGNHPSKNAIAIIPARFTSTRLPGKALLEIAGKPMICWVVERALGARSLSRVIVATDDQRILSVVRNAGHEALLTRADHQSGTDRIAEVATQISDAQIIVNLQGDEPMISPETIDRAVAVLTREDDRVEPVMVDGIESGLFEKRADISTTWEPMESAADVLSSDVVKIVVDHSDNAIYFSRAPVPFPTEAVQKHGSLEEALGKEPNLISTFRKHTGLYVYRREVLLEFMRWSPTELERRERLEQLRALEHGVMIRAVQAAAPSVGVDTLADLERVRHLMGTNKARSEAQV